jgi:signal transduction histidine kinase
MFMKDMTEEQWAARFFAFNLSLSILMSLLVICGIFMALRTASRELRLSQMKADFVSNVSHELRTPLSSIRVFGELLKVGHVREPDKVQEYGEYIENESRRLTRLVNNILDFSRIESGRKRYQFEPSDIREVLTSTVKAFEVRLSQRGFDIDLSAPAKPIPKAALDADAIGLAVTNLLDNAVKYSGDSKRIEVRLGYLDGDISISVTDHGIGIPRDEREKIFEKFHRVGTGLVHDVKGSGLGLSIVKHIVDAHNGRVTVDSRIGAGSTFTIHLPVSLEAEVQEQKEPAVVPATLDPLTGSK